MRTGTVGEKQQYRKSKRHFLERYARQHKLMNIRHYIDDDESGRFFDRSAYTQMINDVESDKIGIVIMKDMTRWGRDYLQVGNAMEIFRRNNVRFIAINNGIDSQDQNTLEFAPFINIMSEWYAGTLARKLKPGIKDQRSKWEARRNRSPYGYIKDPNNKDFWLVDKEAAESRKTHFYALYGGEKPESDSRLS